MNRQYLGALLFIAYFSIGNALECYVCTKQAGNVAKCLKTIVTCEQEEDVCMTEVRWGSYSRDRSTSSCGRTGGIFYPFRSCLGAPYWTSGGQKQFYVSKSCATKKECERTKRANMKYCTSLWYTDWKCSECCVGDRCNYFIFSSGNKHATSLGMLLVALIAPLIGNWAMK